MHNETPCQKTYPKRFPTKLQTCGSNIGSGKVLKVKELLIRLVIMGAITGELSFRILELTLSQPGALFEGRLLGANISKNRAKSKFRSHS